MIKKSKIKEIYEILLKAYGKQGWWPIINDKTLLCEYHVNAPRNEKEALEICFGAIIAQNTQWYPNVVRAIQQLKLGRPFKKQEQEVIRKAEILQAKIFGNSEKITITDILTQNTNWKNVEKAIINLNRNNLIDVKKIIKTKNQKLAEIIKSSGYHNQKAKKLKNFCNFLSAKYEGKLQKFFQNNIKKLRKELLSINGIGPETADSIILYVAKKPIFVIDAYTKRIINRIGYKETTYDELQKLFMQSLPNNEKLFNEYHALLVELGKNICKKVPLCENCPLNNRCNYYKTIFKKGDY